MFLQYYQMKQMNSRNPQAAAANPQMQTMQKFFPIIFGVIYLRVPAGATIYMVVSSAMRIGTQEVMFRSGYVTPVAAEREISPQTGEGAEAGEGDTEVEAARTEEVDRDGRHNGRQEDAPADEVGGSGSNGRSGGNGKKTGGAAKRATNGRPGVARRRIRRPRSPIRGRARNGRERLDSAWSGSKWRARAWKRRPSRHSINSGWPSGDAEVIVVNEPKTGLFGRMRVEARVRARVRPVGARPRRERSRRGGRSAQGNRQGASACF